MIEIIPAILENNFAEIEKKINILDDINLVDSKEKFVSWVQIDFADNTLIPNTTFLDPAPFAALKTQINFEAHLMVSDPLRYVERFASVGFKRFYAHLEGRFIEEFLGLGHQLGIETGLAIDGPTPADKIYKYLDLIDCVLVMAIEAGASGRPFLENTPGKIRNIRMIDCDIPLGVDGSMNPDTARKVIIAGANRIYSNSYIFDSLDLKSAMENLKMAVSGKI